MMDLIDAVQTNDLERVILLVEQGADKEEGDCHHDGTSLWWAANDGHLEMAQHLVEQGAILDKANKGGNTPLIVAAWGGRLEIARYLLEQGADRDKANKDGYTPLFWAAYCGQLEIAMLLMSYGADLNAGNSRGELPIDVARTEEMKQAIRDEPRRRMDHGYKRATEQDRYPNATASGSEQQEEVKQSNERPRLDEGRAVTARVAEEEETKVAEEDEDSEPSSDEEDD